MGILLGNFLPRVKNHKLSDYEQIAIVALFAK